MDQRLQTVWPGWETVRIIGRGSYGAVYEIRRDSFGDPKQRFAHAGELYNELAALRDAEKERPAVPGGAAEQNPSGPAGHLPLQGRQEKTGAKAASSTVGADASPPGTTRRQEPPWSLGGPMGGGSAKQNPSGPAGHLHPPLCPPRGHLSPPGRVFPLQGRQEKTGAKGAKATEKDSSTPLRSASYRTRRTEDSAFGLGNAPSQDDKAGTKAKGKERIATPVTQSSARHDKKVPVGAIHESPAANRTADIYYPGGEEEAAANGGFGDLAALQIHYDADGAQPERTEP